MKPLLAFVCLSAYFSSKVTINAGTHQPVGSTLSESCATNTGRLGFDGRQFRPGILCSKVYDRESADIPLEFDARIKWPFCPSLFQIHDQSDCGSCWAHATAAAIADRICIATQGRFTSDISAEDLMTCCTECGKGCHGGDPALGWQYYMNQGVVTGGVYNGSGCRPYTIAPGYFRAIVFRDTPVCLKSCTNGNDYESDKHYGKSAYSLDSVYDMQQDILLHGPVVAAFQVYSDFFDHKTGVYVKDSDEAVYLHDVRIIGWGVEDGMDYWLVANSWGSGWGENGYFKILRGSMECQIEKYVTAGLPIEPYIEHSSPNHGVQIKHLNLYLAFIFLVFCFSIQTA